MINKGQAWCSL